MYCGVLYRQFRFIGFFRFSVFRYCLLSVFGLLDFFGYCEFIPTCVQLACYRSFLVCFLRAMWISVFWIYSVFMNIPGMGKIERMFYYSGTPEKFDFLNLSDNVKLWITMWINCDIWICVHYACIFCVFLRALWIARKCGKYDTHGCVYRY